MAANVWTRNKALDIMESVPESANAGSFRRVHGHRAEVVELVDTQR